MNAFILQMHAKRQSLLMEEQSSPVINQYNIDWVTFRNTILEWVALNSQVFLTLLDQQGHFTEKDKNSLHLTIAAFFIQFKKEKMLEMLSKAYLAIENLERDIESINIYGNSSNFKEMQKNEGLIHSKI